MYTSGANIFKQLPTIPGVYRPRMSQERTIMNTSNKQIKPQSPRSYVKSPNGSIDINPFLDEMLQKRISEVARVDSLTQAAALKQTLVKHNLNIVTAESLTAGMIAKTLVDIPGQGATVYGGFVVYDTDAKRQFINVDTKGVYNVRTAQQMAAGALEKSRAMVAVAVSGDSMPYPEAKQELGIVYIGVALRLDNEIRSYGKEIFTCDKKEVKNVCDAWKDMNVGGSNPKFAPFQFTSLISDYVRMRTVAEACAEANKIIIDAINSDVKWGTVPLTDYDNVCKSSWIIGHNTYPRPSSNVKDCDPHDASSIYS